MALFFKGGEQLYNEAVDAVGRKDYSTARKKFQEANDKGCSNGPLALAYAALIDVGNSRRNVGAYQALIGKLSGLKESEIKFGLTNVVVADLITECELDIKEIQAASMSDNDYQAKGQQMVAVAGEYMARIGEKTLILDEIFKGNTVATGNREALILQAEGYSIIGKGMVSSDPKGAAEYMQMAYSFRRQLGDSGDEEMRLSQNYARSAKCWICGRPANGQGIHFQAVRADIEPVFRKMSDGDVVKPLSDDAESIYICVPCYTAISNRSDEISREYYEMAMREMRAMEARLEAEISSIRISASMHR
ncbi:MAG: hypothetical protein J5707_05320 [Candidatus Methanomethylophilus sp.]|nr:hypothetical protein [Methanomethylophilus sp.]